MWFGKQMRWLASCTAVNVTGMQPERKLSNSRRCLGRSARKLICTPCVELTISITVPRSAVRRFTEFSFF